MNLAIKRYGSRIGEVVGSLMFVGIATKSDSNHRIFGTFKCSCGNDVIFPLGRVLDGHKKTHCGCQTDWGANRTHGMRKSAEYSSWQAMKRRCLDSSDKDFPRYGGRGITVCQKWIDSFEEFYRDLGPRPEGTTLERDDTTVGYLPGNVRWATPTEQARNRRSSFVWFVEGLRFESAEEAASHFGVSDETIHRWAKGYHDKRRGTTVPPKKGCSAVRRY